MPLAVDSFVLGPFQSNCYVVRSERGAPEAAVIDPGDDPTELRLELARMGTRTGGILVTHTDVDHIGGVAALADGTGAEVWAPAGEVEALRDRRDARRHARPAARSGAHRLRRRRDRRSPASPSRSIDVPGPLRGPRRVPRRRRALLRRPAVRRLGRPRRPRRAATGRRCSPRSARCSSASRRRRSSTRPRPGDDARPRAADEPVPRASCAPSAGVSEQVPGAARDARRPAGRRSVVAPRRARWRR